MPEFGQAREKRAPPPATKPRPVSSSTAQRSGPPPVKAKAPVALPHERGPPSNGVNRAHHVPAPVRQKKPGPPPPPARNISLTPELILNDHSANSSPEPPPPHQATKRIPPAVKAKRSYETQPTAPVKAKVPPPVAQKLLPAPPLVAPRSHTNLFSQGVKDNQEKDEKKYEEIEDLISDFYDELEQEDFFFKTQDENA